jgi:hypothetical protein
MTKTPKFKEGDRVMHNYLGAGTVEQVVESSYVMNYMFAYIVRFDETPSVRYNMAQNPTLVFASNLREVIE